MKNPFFHALESAQTGDSVTLGDAIDHLQFDAQGLIPAIAQQHDTGEVLMMAWMNRAALKETLQSGRVCYWSRSRQALWRKGETSGNRQTLIELRIDCDGDALLCLVDQHGPACHTHRSNCFYLRAETDKLTVIAEPVDH
ncbi:MAG: phosphoribosyl-AMP cyclohydrolase [Cellvibrionaceae bacterium]|nr:phosphoribosyl-AMP cyclohydrolase [Cellvibrionaceae bacterium]